MNKATFEQALGQYYWSAEILGILFVSSLASILIAALFKRLAHARKDKSSFFPQAFALSGAKPLIWMIWVLGISYSGEIGASHGQLTFIEQFLPPLRTLILLILFVWFCIRFLHHAHQELTKRKSYDKTTLIALFQMTRLLVVLTAVLMALQTLGVPLSGVLAFGGMGGLAVGFAAKDLLANFFGGLMIFLDRPFKVGDSIDLPDHHLQGTVEHIGWRLTTIRSLHKEPIYVPNSLFSTVPIHNGSRMTHRHIPANIGLRLTDGLKLERLLTAIEKMLQEHDEIDINQLLIVKLCQIGPSSLEILIDTCTKSIDKKDFYSVRQDVLLKVLQLIEAHGAHIAPAPFTLINTSS
ncbi:MAG: mechanosensitive ion channel family protein [Verrucomicrobia bacterium]|nr:mechanosensitive ion channel family protein [Verrucomicrobiota bacterium]